jgi:2-methylcitrate dehydratase PrpD
MCDNLSEKFLDSIDALLEAPLSEKLEHQAKRCLLDFLGVTFVGAHMLRDELTAYAKLCGDEGGESTMIGFGSKTGLLNAAFMNGMAAHAAELDDGVRFGMIHVGSPVFPALLAAAEKKRSGGKEFLKGVVAGYEAAVLLANGMQPDHYSRGFHPTATCGGVGAAIGVGVLSGFSRRQMKAALSASTISAAGSLKIIENDSGLKPANAGRAAMNGLLAALQADAGFSGVDDPLSGKNGFISMMSGRERLQAPKDRSTDTWIEQVYVKPYAACRHAHPSIEAAQRIRALANIKLLEIACVKITTYASVIGKHDHSHIGGSTSARMSIPYGFAVAFLSGLAGIAQFEEPAISDVDTLALTGKVTVCPDDELTALVPRQRAAIVEVVLYDGRRFKERVDYPLGEPENPISDDDLQARFIEHSMLSGLRLEEAREIIATVWALPGSMDQLYPLLSR